MERRIPAIIYVFVIAIMVMAFATMVLAIEPSYETVSFSSDYFVLMEKDVVYSEQIDLSSSDYINEYTNFELRLVGDWKSGIVNVYIDGVTCSPNGWTTPSADGYQLRFDCTDAVNQVNNKNDVTLTYVSDKDADNVYGTISATYLNNGEPSIEVHGTEYIVGDPAKIWLQLINSTGENIDDGVCYTDVFSPDNSQFIERALMSHLESGVYYYDLNAPFQTGVYPVIAQCYYEASSDERNASSYILYEGKLDGGVLSDTYVDDGNYLKLDTDDTVYPFKRIDVNFSFSDYYSACSGVAEELLTGISIYWKGKWNTGTANHDVEVYVWNYTDNSWLLLTNEIVGGLGGTIQTVSNSIQTNNITTALGLSSTNEMKIRFFDTPIAEGGKDFDTDRLYASCDQLSNPEWQEVKGSSEIHVTAEEYWQTEVLNGTIENSTWTGNFTYNFNIQSLTAINRTEEVYIELPTPFSCHHFLSLSVNGIDIPNFTLSNPLNPLNDGCRVGFDYNLEPGTNYEAQAVSENYYKETEQNWVTKTQFDFEVISLACNNYNVANGLPNYTLPATEPLNYSADDALWRICQQYLDQYYHWNFTYFNEFQVTAGTLSDAELRELDNTWAHMIEVHNNLEQMANDIMNGLQTGSDYSLAILSNPTGQPVPYFATYWANASTSFINFGQISQIVLGITNVSVDTTGIVTAVWNYTSTINSVILDAFGLNVWNQPNRNLTYTPDQTNYTFVGESVWAENNSKYIYGEIIP